MGIREIFNLASIQPPELSPVFEEMVDKIVAEAAAFSKKTKTSVFSQSIEVFIIEPGADFDRQVMISAEERDTGKVKCTVQFGLRAIDHEGNRMVMVMPEVLLVDA